MRKGRRTNDKGMNAQELKEYFILVVINVQGDIQRFDVLLAREGNYHEIIEHQSFVDTILHIDSDSVPNSDDSSSLVSSFTPPLGASGLLVN